MASIRKKLVIIGDGTCGKTCLMHSFIEGKFYDDYVPTTFENKVHEIKIGEKTVELVLWDTAGQDDFDRLRRISYPGTDVLLMCFSIDSPDSLENIQEKWAPEAKRFCPKSPCILVGNKKDLRSDQETLDKLMKRKQEPVTSAQARSVANQIGAYSYIECSAKTREGVVAVFQTATRAAIIKDSHLRSSHSSKPSCMLL